MPPKKVICLRARVPGRRVLSVVAAALCLAAVSARAALQFDAFLGYDDILPERSWFPITCEIYNDGPAFNATVEVTARDFGQGQPRRMALDLPTNTRKRIVIPVFSTARNWNVRLLDERGKVRAEQPLQPRRTMRNNLPLIAALSRTVAGIPVLPESPASMADDSKYAIARLQTALFPDNPLALEGINALYVSSEKAVELSVGQVNALMAWLQRGGHLVLGVEQLSDVNATAWLRDLLPCTLTSMITLSAHDPLQAWTRSPAPDSAKSEPTATQPLRRLGYPRPAPYAGNSQTNRLRRNMQGQSVPLPPQGQPAPSPLNAAGPATEDTQFDSAPMQVATGTLHDGVILIGDPSAPLAVDGYRGRGRITVLNFSAEREPFLSWKNRAWFWSKLAEVPPAAFLNPNSMVVPSRLSSDGIFGAMIDTKQVRKLPLGWLLALLVAYLVVIGPLDQYWLKKINRQMLTWLTFPCYVVVFSALIYFIGFHLRAGELEWNELNVVDILPDNDRAVLRGQTYLSIYSPNNARYPLAGSEKFATLRGEYVGNFGGNQEKGRTLVTQTGNNFQAEADVPVWMSQLLVSDWVQPSGLPFDLTARRGDSGWEVTVDNKMDRALPGVRAVLDGRIYDLGEVPASQIKTFSLGTNRSTRVSEMAGHYGDTFRSAVQARNNTFGNNGNPISDLASGSVAASFLTYVNHGGGQSWDNFTGPASLDLSRFATEGYAIVLAWVPDYSPSELNRFKARRTHRNTLFRLVVPLKS
jgi:hypothetical protein